MVGLQIDFINHKKDFQADEGLYIVVAYNPANTSMGLHNRYIGADPSFRRMMDIIITRTLIAILSKLPKARCMSSNTALVDISWDEARAILGL